MPAPLHTANDPASLGALGDPAGSAPAPQEASERPSPGSPTLPRPAQEDRSRGRLLARVAAFSTSAAAPLTAQALILAGFALAHIDDTDALLYGRMAENVLSAGSWWRLNWTDTQLVDFHDHLPPVVWLVAASRWAFGRVGTNLVYGAAVVLTWWLVYRIAARHRQSRAGWLALWLAPLTESYFFWQASPRIDQPLLLAFVASLALASRGRSRDAIASGLCAGCALILRFPIGLALTVLAPAAAVLATGETPRPRRWREGGARLALFAVALLAPPVLLHAGDLAWGAGDAWSRYLHNQVFASLAGSRVDGAGSHLAPLSALLDRFWPGLPLLACFLWTFVRSRTRLGWFALLWAAAIIGGLSLGRRHVAHHAWAAFPALMLIAGLGLERAIDWSRATLTRLRGRADASASGGTGSAGAHDGTAAIGAAPPSTDLARRPALRAAAGIPLALIAAAAVYATLAPTLLFPVRACDVARAAESLRETKLCDRVAIVDTGARPLWYLAARTVDHFGRDVEFLTPEAAVALPQCSRVIATWSKQAPASGWRPVVRGERFAFYVVAQLPAQK